VPPRRSEYESTRILPRRHGCYSSSSRGDQVLRFQRRLAIFPA
jgi:hypothetical protein